MDANNTHTKGKKRSYQSEAYRLCLLHWHRLSPTHRDTAIRGSLSNALRRHLRANYWCTGRDNAIRAERWKQNYKLVIKHIPPRMGAALLRAGLHGWATEHRCGRRAQCRLCRNNQDSLWHTINCTAVRNIWRKALPTTTFDGLDLLGFIDRSHTLQQRILLCTILHGLYEFIRFWSHQPHHHPYSSTTLPSAILHFAIAGAADCRSHHMRIALATIRSLLTQR